MSILIFSILATIHFIAISDTFIEMILLKEIFRLFKERYFLHQESDV
ncbi:hypothetical protein CUZ91_2634 [Enterococcus xinjiangensis]|nr:hypothetical protein [Enterococcus faecium]MBK4849254.1 hypothetical protein [Enterococcus faecium]MBK4870669.1 hypothetical protein [Enterococcus faecium]MBL5001562.1 hypothetical protein [Enterococcus lactis]